MRYIRDHWMGHRSLFWSFWINLAMFRLVILYLEQFTHPPFLERSILAITLTAVYFLFFHILVYGWQIRGVIKANDRYVSAYGAPVIAMACHFGIAFSLLFTGFAVHASYQSLFVEDRAASENQLSWNHSLLGDYTLTAEGQYIRLEGDLRVGVTEALRAMLQDNPGISGIILHSNGGRVAEGRGLARLIQARKLDTLVLKECKSACTTAFMGGNTRILGKSGKLGFHQFSLDSVYYNPNINAETEQKVDLEFYAGQGISQAFLDDVFQAGHREMWFPKVAYLLKSGVVHKLLTGPHED